MYVLYIRQLAILILTIMIVSCSTTSPFRSSILSTPSSNTLANKNYTCLNEAIHTYQVAELTPWPKITINKKLAPGEESEIIPLLREELKRTGDLVASSNNASNLYDLTLAEAINSFKTRNGLVPNSIIDNATLAELNVPPQERIKQLQINMQRWEKLNNKLTGRYIIVNIPAYRMSVYEDDKEVLSMKTIVGKPTWPTPELYSRITQLVYNPYWHIPDNIAQRDILPKIEKNPDYLEDMNIKVVDQESDHATPIDDSDIDWSQVQPDQYKFRQDPGEKNALGVVKFYFPNPYAIYMHDTSTRSLFNTATRDLSHGCIRLEKPFELVNYLMKSDPSWNTQKMQMVVASKKTTYVHVIQSLPIVITYITAWVDNNGKINFRDDIYHRDK